jgi:hypothetical protein
VVDLRILAVADFHGLPDADNYLLKFLKRGYDCLVLVGDLTDFGPLSAAENIISKVKEIDIPALAVPGNCDPKQVLEILDKYGVNLHAKMVRIGGMSFVGLGGSNLTPFNTPFELQEAEIEEELASLTQGVDEDWVLVTHAPPFNTKVDITHGGVHAGSKSIRRLIERKQPLVALCGHVHESRNTDKLGRTLVVNPGPVSKGYAAEVKIEDGVCAKLLELAV